MLRPSLLAVLALAASVCILVQGSRFNRNEARCAVICSNRDSEECRICNTRIPMRFGKRSGHRVYDLPKPGILALMLPADDDSASQYDED